MGETHRHFSSAGSELLPGLPEWDFEEALAELLRVHLGSQWAQPSGRISHSSSAPDWVRWTTLYGVSAAKSSASAVQPGRGLSRLADAPGAGTPDPGLRLLPEFDGLLVGYHGRNRTRFLTEQQLPKVWAKVNGLFSPVVLYDGQLVASWKTITKGRRTDIEVTMLDPHPILADDLFGDRRSPPQHRFLTSRSLTCASGPRYAEAAKGARDDLVGDRGAGYIGSHVVRAFITNGIPAVIDDLSSGHRSFVNGDIPYEGSTLQGELLDQIFTEHTISGVVHLAGFKYAGVSVSRPLHTYTQNVTGMVTLLESMAAHGVTNFVFSSSAAVYGTPGTDLVSEQDPTHPESPTANPS